MSTAFIRSITKNKTKMRHFSFLALSSISLSLTVKIHEGTAKECASYLAVPGSNLRVPEIFLKMNHRAQFAEIVVALTMNGTQH